MIKLEEIPYMYGLCLNDACPSAGTCLRHLALSAHSEERDFIPVLHPRHYPVAEETQCAHYRSHVKVHYARGFRQALAVFPVHMLTAFRDRMITRYPRNKYFALRRGELPLTPEEQEYIIRVARKVGYQGDFTFDAYEEGYLW